MKLKCIETIRYTPQSTPRRCRNWAHHDPDTSSKMTKCRLHSAENVRRQFQQSLAGRLLTAEEKIDQLQAELATAKRELNTGIEIEHNAIAEVEIHKAEIERLRAELAQLKQERSLPKCDASSLGDGSRCVLLSHDGYRSHQLGNPCQKLVENKRLRAEVVAAKADSERLRTAISKAKVGDWLLNWFGENAPAYDPGEGSGYTYAQIADCTNYVCKHLDAALAQREGVAESPNAGMVSWSGSEECGCPPDLRKIGRHMSRCERLRGG